MTSQMTLIPISLSPLATQYGKPIRRVILQPLRLGIRNVGEKRKIMHCRTIKISLLPTLLVDTLSFYSSKILRDNKRKSKFVNCTNILHYFADYGNREIKLGSFTDIIVHDISHLG